MHHALYKQYASVGRELNDPEHPLSGAILQVWADVVFVLMIGSAVEHGVLGSVFETFDHTNWQLNSFWPSLSQHLGRS